jgi:hypothetical protein
MSYKHMFEDNDAGPSFRPLKSWEKVSDTLEDKLEQNRIAAWLIDLKQTMKERQELQRLKQRVQELESELPYKLEW